MVIRKTAKARQPAKKRTNGGSASKKGAQPRTFWDDLADIGRRVPKKDWDFLPRDAAERFDDYLESGFFDK